MEEHRYLFDAPKLALYRLEAAQALGVSPATLDRLVKRGLIRPSRATRRPIFPIVELERFLRETTGSIDGNGAQRPDASGEVLQYLRDSEPQRQDDYDELEPSGRQT